MRKKFSILLASTLLASAFLAMAGCGETPPKDPSTGNDPTPPPPIDTPVEAGSKNPNDPNDPYLYEGTATVGPYTIYAPGGEAVADDLDTYVYDSMYLAIRNAANVSKSTKKYVVKDANGLVIFERQSNSQYHCFDGTFYVGVKPAEEALAWGKTRPRSYVLNGRGTDYIYLGMEDISGQHPDNVYELISGGFSYLFTPAGYAYACGTVRMSELTMKESTNSQWNAYVFFNIRGGDNCDLGIGMFASPTKGGRSDGRWKLVYNCTGTHTGGSVYVLNADGSETRSVNPTDHFFVLQDQIVTTMNYDEATGIYSGADDLFIETMGTANEWILRVTNLRTNRVFGYRHVHTGMNGSEVAKNGFRIVCAASYCPVEGQVWDAQAGGYLKNLIWENVKVARFKETAASLTDYKADDKKVFYPKTETVQYGFTQAADCSHLSYGMHPANGQYPNGSRYEAGSTYINFSSYYDGTHMY